MKWHIDGKTYVVDKQVPVPPKKAGRPPSGKTKTERQRDYRQRNLVKNITVDEATLKMAKRVKDKLSKQFGQDLTYRQLLSYLFSKEL